MSDKIQNADTNNESNVQDNNNNNQPQEGPEEVKKEEQSSAATAAAAQQQTEDDKLIEIVRKTFNLFDKLGTGTVGSEEIGTLMRYLGQFPTETELVEVVLRELQDDAGGRSTISATKSKPIAYERFEKFILRCLKDHEYDPDDSETLLEAFHVLDPERKGWVDSNEMRDYLGSGHTGFREKEMSEFIEFARDREDDQNINRLYYEDYVAQLTSNVENHIDNLYHHIIT